MGGQYELTKILKSFNMKAVTLYSTHLRIMKKVEHIERRNISLVEGHGRSVTIIVTTRNIHCLIHLHSRTHCCTRCCPRTRWCRTLDPGSEIGNDSPSWQGSSRFHIRHPGCNHSRNKREPTLNPPESVGTNPHDHPHLIRVRNLCSRGFSWQ